MRIENLLPKTRTGLISWAAEVHKDELLFDANGSSPEFWANVWFELRECRDEPRWFPSGKWATLQQIEELLVNNARSAMLEAGGRP